MAKKNNVKGAARSASNAGAKAAGSLRPTLNSVDERVRAQMVELLNQHLAHVLDLASQAKQAHWNVKGPFFVSLHELFDGLAEAVNEHADDLAERAVQLGGEARGTVRMAAAASGLEEFPTGAREGMDYVEFIAERVAGVAASVRQAIDEAAEAGDADTADLFTEVSRDLDKKLWMLESHLLAGR